MDKLNLSKPRDRRCCQFSQRAYPCFRHPSLGSARTARTFRILVDDASLSTPLSIKDPRRPTTVRCSKPTLHPGATIRSDSKQSQKHTSMNHVCQPFRPVIAAASPQRAETRTTNRRKITKQTRDRKQKAATVTPPCHTAAFSKATTIREPFQKIISPSSPSRATFKPPRCKHDVLASTAAHTREKRRGATPSPS